jgi:hypothetical protein
MSEIQQAEVQELAEVWYRKLDVHAPLEEFRPLIAEDEVTMVFPEATVEGFDGFQGWYENVIGIFFDEEHTVKEVKVTPKDGDRADVKVVVKWEASIWNPPEPYSKRIVLDAYQTWEIKRSPSTQKPIVTRYIVDSLDYAEGSATL